MEVGAPRRGFRQDDATGWSSVLDRLRLLVQALGLVDHLSGDGLEGVAVGTGMVGAEHELAAGLQEHVDVRLGAATVAAVARGEPGGFESEVHGALSSIAAPARGSVRGRGSLGAQQPVSPVPVLGL